MSSPNSNSRRSALLPVSEKKTLFLSMDTILHLTLSPPLLGCDFEQPVVDDRKIYTVYVTVRYGLEAFLRAAVKAEFEVIAFTWWPRGFTSEILGRIDPAGQIFQLRLFQDHHVQRSKERLVLNLEQTGRRLDRSLVIDPDPAVNTTPWCNSIRLSRYNGDVNDVELHSLLGFFEAQANFTDLRSLLHVSSNTPQVPGLPLPPTAHSSQRTLFLDLDETLIHHVPRKQPNHCDFSTDLCSVIKRPGVDNFLQAAADNGYEIVIFTAGDRDYACPIIDKLDPKGLVAHRLYRDSCQGDMPGKIVKDLALTGRSLDRCVIIDDICSRVPQKKNAISIKPFLGYNMQDCELTKLLDFFSIAREYEDLRDAVHLVNYRLGCSKL